MTLGDKAGNLKSYDFTETFRFDPNSTAAADLNIIGDPVAKSYFAGETIELTVNVAGGDKVSYEWFKDGVSLLTGGLGAMTANLKILNAEEADAGTYYCVVSNSSGRVVSKAVDVTFKGNGSDVIQPTITLERWNNGINIGWPTIGFKLQSSLVLAATNWQDVVGSETTNSLRVTNSSGNQFYRLMK